MTASRTSHSTVVERIDAGLGVAAGDAERSLRVRAGCERLRGRERDQLVCLHDRRLGLGLWGRHVFPSAQCGRVCSLANVRSELVELVELALELRRRPRTCGRPRRSARTRRRRSRAGGAGPPRRCARTAPRGRGRSAAPPRRKRQPPRSSRARPAAWRSARSSPRRSFVRSNGWRRAVALDDPERALLDALERREAPAAVQALAPAAHGLAAVGQARLEHAGLTCAERAVHDA